MIEIDDCKNISDIARKYYGRSTGYTRRKSKKLLEENGIDIEKWYQEKEAKARTQEIANRRNTISEIALKIYELRDLGYSYSEISKKLDCSKGTVAYWCGENQAEKAKKRKEKLETWELSMIRKCEYFRNGRNSHFYIKTIDRDWNKKLRKATSFFCKRAGMKNWGYKEVLKKFGYVTHCYLTGETIDFRKDDWSPDHIIPIAQCGNGSLDNFGVTTPIINQMKGNQTPEQFIDMCEKVVRYNRPELFK